MSMIDTDKIRNQIDKSGWPSIATELCDEIDRLRGLVDGLHLECERSAITVTTQAKELATLRDQLRPRSIKDEPPPEMTPILVLEGLIWKPTSFMSLKHCQAALGPKALWLPMPPPTPDKFEEWLKSEERRCGCNFTPFFVDGARAGWDAAKKDQP